MIIFYLIELIILILWIFVLDVKLVFRPTFTGACITYDCLWFQEYSQMFSP